MKPSTKEAERLHEYDEPEFACAGGLWPSGEEIFQGGAYWRVGDNFYIAPDGFTSHANEDDGRVRKGTIIEVRRSSVIVRLDPGIEP